MFLEKAEAENFMSYESLERSFTDKPRGLTLIEGRNLDDGDSNGAGKSTPWDLVSWVLFGETVRGLTGDAIVHRKHKADCLGRVKLSLGADTFIVTRYRKHSGKDAAGTLLGNRLQVHWFPDHDGSGSAPDEVVELGSIDATQKWLTDALGFDFDLLRCTMLFAQGETFNFVNETDKRQKEILSKIKRLDVARGLEAARKGLREVTDKRLEISRKIDVLRSHLIENPEEVFAEEWEDFEVDKKRQLASVDERIRLIEMERDALEAKCEDLAKLVNAKKRLKELLEERNVKIEQVRALKQPRADELVVIKARLKRLSTLASPTCPTCDKPIDAAAVRDEQNALIKRGQILQEAIQRVETRMNQIVASGLDVKLKLDEVEEREREQRRRTERIAKIDPEAAEWHAEHARIEARVNPWQQKREEALAKQKQIKVKMKELTLELAPLVDREPYLRFWETGFSDKGLKSFVFDTLCATLTAKTNHYLGILSGGAVSVTFDTQTRLKTGEMREKFECMVMSDGEPVSYKAYSGGEKTRISLAVDMSLADLMSDHYGTRFNVVVFDEQDLYLDRQGRQFYLQLLKERAKTQRVFVVAHDAEFKGMFDEAWVAEKKDGVSRFVA